MSAVATKRPDRSRLGQILIEKRLISQEQLDAAIRAQAASGRRLGEILADMRLITRAQVRGAVRRQRSLRLAAALATALLGPLHVYAAVAAAPAAAASPRVPGMRALGDDELGDVAGRDGVRVRGELATVFDPLTALLTADTSVRDVDYDTANSQATVNRDGSVTLRLPSTIGEIRFENIRVGSQPGPSFGSIEIHDIDLRGTTISVKPLGK